MKKEEIIFKKIKIKPPKVPMLSLYDLNRYLKKKKELEEKYSKSNITFP